MNGDDYRSVCVIVEPVYGPTIGWRAMAFVGGQIVGNVLGGDRTVVLDDVLASVAAAGVDLEPEPQP